MNRTFVRLVMTSVFALVCISESLASELSEEQEENLDDPGTLKVILAERQKGRKLKAEAGINADLLEMHLKDVFRQYETMRDSMQAIKTLDKLVSLIPTDPVFWHKRGILRMEWAIKSVEQAAPRGSVDAAVREKYIGPIRKPVLDACKDLALARSLYVAQGNKKEADLMDETIQSGVYFVRSVDTE